MADFKIDTSDITINVLADTWTSALRLAAQPSLDNGSNSDTYVENMITAVIKYGPYIDFAPGLALGHAEPDENVLKTGVDIDTLDTPVKFGSKTHDPVDVVVVLASIHSKDHLKLLTKLVNFLGSYTNMQALRTMQSSEDAARIVLDILEG